MRGCAAEHALALAAGCFKRVKRDGTYYKNGHDFPLDLSRDLPIFAVEQVELLLRVCWDRGAIGHDGELRGGLCRANAEVGGHEANGGFDDFLRVRAVLVHDGNDCVYSDGVVALEP